MKQPEAHANAKNRQQTIFTAERHINGRNIAESARAAQSAPNEKEEEKI